MTRRASGFSLLEALVVVALMLVFSVIAAVQWRAAQTTLDADVAARLVSSQLRYARQLAVDQRRNFEIQFLGGATIRIRKMDATPVVVSEVTLPGGYTYTKPSGAPDTPDGYGSATAVYFNAASGGTFLGDGTFVDGAGMVLNGSVFTGAANASTARAVTMLGSTGRTKTYAWSGAAWQQR